MLNALTVDWTQLTVGVAAILGLIYVSRTMKKVLDVVLTFVGNHMTAVTDAQVKTAEALGEVAATLSILTGDVKTLHEDNMETALLLKSQAAPVRRAVKASKS